MIGPQASPARWTRQPGKIDALHTADLYHSDNPWGLPVIGNAGDLRPDALWPYNVRTRSLRQQAAAVHFYLDDYQIETPWGRPRRALSYVARFGAALTPDYSIWSHWPPALQVFNIYRSRWVGAYWLSQGLTVIPSVSWAGPDSYPYAFAGIRPGSTIAISTVGIKGPEAQAAHLAGWVAMIETLQPSNILIYGRLLADCPIPVDEYPSYWEQRKETATK